MTGADFNSPDQWGELVAPSRDGGQGGFELGHGHKLVSFVTLTEDVARDLATWARRGGRFRNSPTTLTQGAISGRPRGRGGPFRLSCPRGATGGACAQPEKEEAVSLEGPRVLPTERRLDAGKGAER